MGDQQMRDDPGETHSGLTDTTPDLENLNLEDFNPTTQEHRIRMLLGDNEIDQSEEAEIGSDEWVIIKVKSAGYSHIARRTWQEVHDRDIPHIRNAPEDYFVLACIKIMAATPTCVLVAMFAGTVHRDSLHNEEFQRVETLNNKHDDDDSKKEFVTKSSGAQRVAKVLIYHRSLCDDDGLAPTANQWLKVLPYLEKYHSDPETSYVIDHKTGTFNEDSISRANGGRRYLLSESKKHDFTREVYIVDHIEIFCKAVRGRLQEVPSADMDKPLGKPLGYVGFTSQQRSRRLQHDTHKGSSKLMSVVESAFRAYVNTPQVPIHVADSDMENTHSDSAAVTFEMRHHIIYFIQSELQSGIAETFFTIAGKCFSHEGTGLVYSPPGASTDTAKVSKTHWAWLNAWTLRHTPFELNIERIEKRMMFEMQESETLKQIQGNRKQVAVRNKEGMARNRAETARVLKMIADEISATVAKREEEAQHKKDKP